jgi:hypothetical protein
VSNYWVQHPTLPSSPPPDESQLLRTSTHYPTGEYEVIPSSSSQQTNSAFHLLVTSEHQGTELCQTITSTMILNYPPPTLVRSGSRLDISYPPHDGIVSRIRGIVNYLKNEQHVNGTDLVLIVDGQDTFFQLPPEILIRRFFDIIRKSDDRLRKKYGFAVVEERGVQRRVQKYSQRVVFGASKECGSHNKNDIACVTPPKSTLPPDIYGFKTDIQPDGRRNRPRWLDTGAVIGQAADLLPIYERVLQWVLHHSEKDSDKLVLEKLFGQQEYVRELERRRTSNPWKEFFWGLLGISDTSNITNVRIDLISGQRYEFGIGVDYESQLFFNMKRAKGDTEWLRYDNITQVSKVQMAHGVPREVRLNLPADIQQYAENPFIVRKPEQGEVPRPALNDTLDKLPSPESRRWDNLDLLTNVHSKAVPVSIHLNGEEELRLHWWTKMWYYQWSRALLRKYMRAPGGRKHSIAAWLGGLDWWDQRGGQGGMWTEDNHWISYGEICMGMEEKLFDDKLGLWGSEGEESGQPKYNKWGHLLWGHDFEEDLALDNEDEEEEEW